MAKEPWGEEIYDDGEERFETNKQIEWMLQLNRVLTILAVIFFIMVIVAMVAGMSLPFCWWRWDKKPLNERFS